MKKVFLMFIILSSSCRSIITDFDGNEYHQIVIGKQTWLLEDLKSAHFSDGTPISSNLDSAEWDSTRNAAYCSYKNANPSSVSSYLYNWHAVCNAKKICPKGWKVPDTTDWNILINFFGDKSQAADSIKRFFKNNKTQLADFFVGGRYRYMNNDGFQGMGSEKNWWTSTLEFDSYTGYNVDSNYIPILICLRANKNTIQRFRCYRNNGFSVKCIKE